MARGAVKRVVRVDPSGALVVHNGKEGADAAYERYALTLEGDTLVAHPLEGVGYEGDPAPLRDHEPANVSTPGPGEAGGPPAVEPGDQLTGDALQERARELDIEGRSQLSADELRDAIAKAEASEAS